MPLISGQKALVVGELNARAILLEYFNIDNPSKPPFDKGGLVAALLGGAADRCVRAGAIKRADYQCGVMCDITAFWLPAATDIKPSNITLSSYS